MSIQTRSFRWSIILRPMIFLAILSAGCLLPVGEGKAAPSAEIPAIASGANLEPGDLGPWFDGFMTEQMKHGDIAGSVVVVVKDGKVIFSRGYGWSNVATRQGVDPDRTLFRVGSLSKLFTWTAVMQQVEAGKLNLDTDVNRYLDFHIPPFEGRPITLRQLMTHTAGFEEVGKDVISFHAPIPLDTYLKRWIPKRIHAPGTTPAYSNWGAALAGYIVQRSSGRPFAQYIQARILAPLGMSHSTFEQPLPPALRPFLSQGYPKASSQPQPFETIGPSPAGGLSASGRDIARFMIAHLDGGKGLMSPATAAMMHNSPLASVDPISVIPPLNRAELGFLEQNLNGHEVIGHRGATQNFHSLMALYTNDHVGLFVALNSAGTDNASEALLNGLTDAFADRYFPGTPVKSRVAPELARVHSKMMAGQWLLSRRTEGNFLELASLFGQTRIEQTQDGGLLVPSLKDPSGSPYRWDEVSPFLWLSRGGHERLAAKVSGGRVVRWSTDTLAPVQVFERVPWIYSARWLVPAFVISLFICLVALAAWPIAWAVRRSYAVETPIKGLSLLSYRVVRIFIAVELLILLGWVTLLAKMLTDLDLLTSRSDPILRILEIGGVIGFVGALLAALWNWWLCVRQRGGVLNKIWNSLVVAATFILIFVALSFGLLSMTVNY